MLEGVGAGLQTYIYIYINISQVAKEQLPKRVKRLSDSDVHVDGFEAYNPNKDHARSSR
jgi:hypothetical protein